VEFIGDVLLPASLWFIMFSMGLSLTLEDFGRVFTNRRALIVGATSMLVVLPLLGATISVLFAPTAALAVGFILLATCPGGMLSNLMTDIAKGDLALSLSLSILVSLVYIFIVPFYAFGATSYFLGIEGVIEIPLLNSIGRIFSITLLPVSLGVTVRRFRPAVAIASKPYIKWIATTVLVIAFIAILVDQIETLKAAFGPLLFMVALMNVLALAFASVFCRVARVSDPERIAICIEHLIRQEGTAIYIAVSILGSREMSLPMIINTPVALVICIAFVMFVRWRQAARSQNLAADGTRLTVER
jgi:bile acid:Na+ symporter, BASS family